MRARWIFFVLSSAVLLPSCSSLREMDRAQLNHAAMALEPGPGPALSFPYSSLGGIRESAQGGACAVCAK